MRLNQLRHSTAPSFEVVEQAAGWWPHPSDHFE
jgi:hypothetical protein